MAGDAVKAQPGGALGGAWRSQPEPAQIPDVQGELGLPAAAPVVFLQPRPGIAQEAELAVDVRAVDLRELALPPLHRPVQQGGHAAGGDAPQQRHQHLGGERGPAIVVAALQRELQLQPEPGTRQQAQVIVRLAAGGAGADELLHLRAARFAPPRQVRDTEWLVAVGPQGAERQPAGRPVLRPLGRLGQAGRPAGRVGLAGPLPAFMVADAQPTAGGAIAAPCHQAGGGGSSPNYGGIGRGHEPVQSGRPWRFQRWWWA
jgi:hypothetical protein